MGCMRVQAQMPRGCQEAARASVRSGWGCPMLDTASSSRIQRTHFRARLSPRDTMVVPRESLGEEEKSTAQMWGEKCEKHTASTDEKEVLEQISLQPWERISQSRYPCCSPWRTPGQSMFILKDWSHARAGEQCAEEAVAEGCYELTATPPFLISLWEGRGGRGIRNEGVKWIWEKVWGWRTLNKLVLIAPSWVCFVCDGNW